MASDRAPPEAVVRSAPARQDVHVHGRAGRVLLDFNRAINPPCVFTPYATCPLPAPENRLPFAVSAGEKLPAAHP